MVDLETLDPFSRRFAEWVFARRPAWRDLASAERASGVALPFLVVEIPAPIEGRPGVFVDSVGEEVTIHYDRWHAHYGEWTVPNDRQPFEEVLAFLDDLFAERVAIAVSMAGEQWAGCQTIEADEIPTPAPGERVYVRSWRGGLDRDLEQPGT